MEALEKDKYTKEDVKSLLWLCFRQYIEPTLNRGHAEHIKESITKFISKNISPHDEKTSL